jgi:hypothetical protein
LSKLRAVHAPTQQDRQTDRQTGRQTGMQAGRQAYLVHQLYDPGGDGRLPAVRRVQELSLRHLLLNDIA